MSVLESQPRGSVLYSRFVDLGRYLAFHIQVLASLPTALCQPRDLLGQCERVGLGAVPLVAVAGLSVGLVSWLQARTLLARYGSESELPGIVALFVVLGLGPVMTALVTAGQVGARLGAELGAMKNTEQLDALEAMGRSPIRHLAGVRVLACVLMLPLLTVVLSYCALAASAGAEVLGGTLTWTQYAHASLMYLDFQRVVLANSASLVFGHLIGVTACWCGFRAGEGTEGVGRASTHSVVGSMFLVLAANVIWVQLTNVLTSR